MTHILQTLLTTSLSVRKKSGAPMDHRALASIRNDYPDCIIEPLPCRATDDGVDGVCRHDQDDASACDGDNGSAVIVGHRAVLSKLTYFAALLARADPERVDRDGPDGAQRSFRLVYRASIPFRRDSLAFLVGLLYGTVSHLAIASRCTDPIDAIGAAVYLGLDAARIESIVETVAVALLRALGHAQRGDRQENGGGGDDNGVGDAYRRLAAFTLHMADSGLSAETKGAVLGRLFGLLDDADRLKIDTALVPTDYYRPDAAGVGKVDTDSNGVRWREITLACDQYGGGGWGAAVSHQGLVFCARASCGAHFDEEDVTVSILVTPEGETLGVWQRSRSAPDGAIDVTARRMTVRIEAYHPVAHVASRECVVWPRPVRDTGDTRRTSASPSPPKDAVFAPCGFAKTARDGRTVARRCPLNVTLDDLVGRRARAVACLVRIRAQEQAPSPQ